MGCKSGDSEMRTALGFRLPGRILIVGASCLTVVVLALQVGSAWEFQALAFVAAAVVAVLAAAAPSWLLAVGAAFVFAGGFGVAGIPLPEVGAVLMIIGAFMSPGHQWRLPSVLLVALSPLLAWVLLLGWDGRGDPEATKRLLSLALWLLLVAALSMPLADRPVIARGLLVGLVVSLPVGFLLGFGYGTREGGLVGDPNTFAMIVVICVPLIVDQLSLKRWQSIGVWSLGAASVVAADSRTGMLSMVVGISVYLLLPTLRFWALSIPLLAVFTASNVPEDLIQSGRWDGREGSDALRERIDAASSRQIAESPWTGHGLGNASVDLSVYGNPPQDLTFFLHNSYKAMITELGIIGISLYAVIAAGAIVNALRGGMNRGALAALAAGGVMATHLGEVLFAIPTALAMGFAWGPVTTVDANVGSKDGATGRPVGQSDPTIAVAA